MSSESGRTDPDYSDDAHLVAFLDGESDAADEARMRSRLAEDAGLQARLDALRQSGPSFRSAFDALLSEAPVARMEARLTRAINARPRARWIAPNWRAAAVAALVVFAFACGFVTSRWSSEGEDDWRRSVAEYMKLYVPETFGATDPEILRREVAGLANWLGLGLDADRLAVGGLKARRIAQLAYEGAPLGLVGYIDDGAPVAFCILRQSAGDAPIKVEMREGLASASWAKDGHGYIVIGNRPVERIAELATTLQRRF